MKKQIAIISLTIISFILFFIGCVNQKETKDTNEAMKSINKTSTDYTTLVKPIIADRCDQCHSNRSEKYSTLKNDAYSEKVKKLISTDKMPPNNPLSTENKKIVLDWLDSILSDK